MSSYPPRPSGVTLARLSASDLSWLEPLQADPETIRFVMGGRDLEATRADVAVSASA